MVCPDDCAVDHLQTGIATATVIERVEDQLPQARLVITVNPTNVAPSAPFIVEGTNVQLNGTVELRFSGQRLPRKGQVYGLIRADNATSITNNATFKITGARARFDVIVEPFGIALVIK